MKTLETLCTDYYHHYPERKICIARELTKMYEQKVIGNLQEVYQYFIDHPEKIRGECVVVINA
jgi:16S rRNA (cytidine1402-2'-O)-methyltransferase